MGKTLWAFLLPVALAVDLGAGVVATNTIGVGGVKTSLTVADFDNAADSNNLSGGMGTMPDESITRSYDTTIRLGAIGSSLKLGYNVGVSSWDGFWVQLAPGGATVDLSTFRTLVFWVRGATGGVEHAKIELGNASSKGIVYLNDAAGAVTNAWREIRIPLTSFTAAGLNSLANVKEVNFVFESGYATDHGLPLTGTIYIDGLEFSTLD